VDRLRSLPIPRSAFLSGRAIADAAVLVYSLAFMTLTGFAVGYRIHGTVPDALLASPCAWRSGSRSSGCSSPIGLFAGSAEAAQGLALLVFPLSFVSSAYVPVESMPGWIQAFAEHQSLTYMVDAVPGADPGPGGRDAAGTPGKLRRDQGATQGGWNRRGVRAAGGGSLSAKLTGEVLA
jgi:ABC-2 type transport system permease protein